jgi:hypothetical protein
MPNNLWMKWIAPFTGKVPQTEVENLNQKANVSDLAQKANVSDLALKADISTLMQLDTNLRSDLLGKEPVLQTSNSQNFLAGNKTWRDFATDVRATVLTGISTASTALGNASDSLLVYLGKLQAQISNKALAADVFTGTDVLKIPTAKAMSDAFFVPERSTAIATNGMLNNLARTNLNTLSFTANSIAPSLTGLATPTAGIEVTIINNSSFPMNLMHNNAASTAANRLSNLGGVNVILPIGGIAVYKYDNLISLWRMVSVNQLNQTQINNIQSWLVKDSQPTAAITGVSTEVLTGSSILTPANTFNANDVLNLESFSFAKTGALGIATLRFYTNTTDTLVGAKLLATGNEVSANRLGAKMSRTFEISDGLIKNRLTGTTNSWTDNVASLTSGLSEAFNPAIANYFFTTIQLSVANDSVVRTQLLISK